MTAVIKDWDAFNLVAPPLVPTSASAGSEVVKGLKKGRPVSAGELLARQMDPHRGDIHAPVAGFIVEINEREIIIERDPRAVGEPPQPRSLIDLTAEELSLALKELGADFEDILPENPIIISTLNPEPGLTFAPALFGEHRETMLAGVEVVRRLSLRRRIIWAVARPEDALTESEVVVVPPGYPHCLPALIKKRILGWSEPTGSGVLGGRELYFLGRIWRTGLPVTRMVLSLGGADYLVPVGSRVMDLLSSANLGPTQEDMVVAGGLISGTSLVRLSQGLGREVAGLHLVRGGASNSTFGPCRACFGCQKNCPVGLPVAKMAAVDPHQWLTEDWGRVWETCLLCGACAVACPARRPLGSMVRLLRGGRT